MISHIYLLLFFTQPWVIFSKTPRARKELCALCYTRLLLISLSLHPTLCISPVTYTLSLQLFQLAPFRYLYELPFSTQMRTHPVAVLDTHRWSKYIVTSGTGTVCWEERFRLGLRISLSSNFFHLEVRETERKKGGETERRTQKERETHDKSRRELVRRTGYVRLSERTKPSCRATIPSTGEESVLLAGERRYTIGPVICGRTRPSMASCITVEIQSSGWASSL